MFKTYYDKLQNHLSGKRALQHACEQNKLERFFTFPNFKKSALRCAAQLKKAGLTDVEIEPFPADGKTSWSGWQTFKAWDVTSAKLWMTHPRHELLADWSNIPQNLVMYSGPTSLEAELVPWNGTTDTDLTGKIPLTARRITDVYDSMRQIGAPGIVSDFIGELPGVRHPGDLPDEVRWENAGLRPAHGDCWGFMLTPRQGKMLRNLMQQGQVRVRAEIDSRVYDGSFMSVTGLIRGDELPDEEILFISHLYEPGANDNASGVGVGLEMARAINELVTSTKRGRLKRTIRFLFTWEGYGLYAWLHKHQDRIPNILGGINIDEIGVDQIEGNSILHLFMPPAANPSWIGDLLNQLCDEYLPDQLRFKPVADRAEIINDTISSDPNIDIVLPCLIQYPARHYHTSSDRIETLSPLMMQTVGLISATHLCFLADCCDQNASCMVNMVRDACLKQLHNTKLRLHDQSWPFDRQRTSAWFNEQFQLKTASLARFGVSDQQTIALTCELSDALDKLCENQSVQFLVSTSRCNDATLINQAARLRPHRTTLGTPKAFTSLNMSPQQSKAYRQLLYTQNMDRLFHRICYWVNAERSILDIVDRLDFELDELCADTAIARTSSGSLIDETSPAQVNLKAVMYVVDLLIENGYLGEVASG